MEYMAALAASAAVILLIWQIVKKIRHGGGCCTEHEEMPEKIKPSDKDTSHYPYTYIAEIDGMVCGGCVRRVENAFNGKDGFYAAADLKSRTARIYTKLPLERRAASEILDTSGYTLTDLKEEKK